MYPDHETPAFSHGVHNLLSPELIPQDAASDESNWYTQDGRIKLAPGRLRVGAEGAVGSVQGQIFGFKADGTRIHWRKIGTKIQYLNGSTWTDVVTGLTSTADYVFSNYASLAGTFTFAFGVDGIFKFHNANPGSYLSLYDSTKNFKGFAFIDRGRAILWNRVEDKTGLYGSYIDRQDSTVYTTVSAEILGTGNASTKTFTGNLANLTAGGTLNGFAVQPYGKITADKTITAINVAGVPTITSAAHGFAAGDKVLIQAVVGMTQINGQIVTVLSAATNTFTINISTLSYTAYSSAGTAAKVELFTDNYGGGFTSNLGGTGTINYMTGAYSLTFNTAPANAASNIYTNYQYEASNAKGVTDFTKSATRLAGEGFVFRQDDGGDAILNVLIGQDGNYYSLKTRSAYVLSLDTTDLSATNKVYRRDMGVPSLRAGISTNKGIVFMDTANIEKPELTILQRNPIGDNVEPVVLMPQFKFANYVYDDCNIDTFERYILICCKTLNATANDIILLCDLAAGTVDITAYNARTTQTDSGYLYIGSSITQTVYQLYTGFDDDGLAINNYWISKLDNLKPHTKKIFPDGLKKVRKLRLRGRIGPNQSFVVYANYDTSGWQLVGTNRGDGSYVDYTHPEEVGVDIIGTSQIGGDTFTNVFPYYTELKLKSPKFRVRAIKFVALGIGYLDIENMSEHNILLFENKLPKRFRQKQNVSLDGQSTDQPNPSY